MAVRMMSAIWSSISDPDGRGQHQHRQQQERQEERQGGEEFMQKLRLGLFGLEE
mgnify:CR=1 FL=1